MPEPTRPPCSGSWPEPPPDTRPTLPSVGPPALVMTLFSMSTASDGCAAAMPASASVTTVSGEFMSFFMTRLPGFCQCWRSDPPGDAAGLARPSRGAADDGVPHLLFETSQDPEYRSASSNGILDG